MPKIFANVIFYDDFSDNSAGWSLGPTWAISPTTSSGSCATGGVSGGSDPALDNTATTDNGVAGVFIGGCTGSGTHGDYWLTSSAIDTTGATGALTFDYYRWLVSDYTPFMQNKVEVYNGSNWVNLWSSGSSPATVDTSWTLQSFDITSFSNSNLAVRFGYNIGSSGVWDSPSWSVDDVCIYSNSSGSCAPSVPEPSAPLIFGLGLVLLTSSKKLIAKQQA